MSSKQATSPFAGTDGGEDGAGQERLAWEKEEGTETPMAAPQLPIHNLMLGKSHGEELPPVSSSVPPESDWESLVSTNQCMVRNTHRCLSKWAQTFTWFISAVRKGRSEQSYVRMRLD